MHFGSFLILQSNVLCTLDFDGGEVFLIFWLNRSGKIGTTAKNGKIKSTMIWIVRIVQSCQRRIHTKLRKENFIASSILYLAKKKKMETLFMKGECYPLSFNSVGSTTKNVTADDSSKKKKKQTLSHGSLKYIWHKKHKNL